MITKIQNPFPEIEISVKRFYLDDVIISSICPHCRKETSRDLGQNYLSYPDVNQDIKIGFYHDCDDGNEEEWDETIKIRLQIEKGENNKDNKDKEISF